MAYFAIHFVPASNHIENKNCAFFSTAPDRSATFSLVLRRQVANVSITIVHRTSMHWHTVILHVKTPPTTPDPQPEPKPDPEREPGSDPDVIPAMDPQPEPLPM